MTKYIALLRGINVGGKNIIKMADLKTAFEQRGFQNVITYINSGNILFSSKLDETDIKCVCEKLLKEDFGLDIPVCVIPPLTCVTHWLTPRTGGAQTPNPSITLSSSYRQWQQKRCLRRSAQVSRNTRESAITVI